MPQYKLTYFNGRGRAEVTRYLFALAEVEFEDNRVQGEVWTALKPDTPFGQLPIMEVDGTMLCQSSAIERLIASRHGLYGANDMEQAKADMVVACAEDMVQALFKGTTGSDEEKAEKKKKTEEETLPTMLANFEKMITPGGFFLGDDIMWPDVSVAHLITMADMKMVGPISYDLSKYPKLEALKQAVESHPKIAEYIRSRPETPF